MVVRIHNLTKWSPLKPGDVLELKGLASRPVRIEVNTETTTRLDWIEGEKGTFLAVVNGYEVVEFVAGPEGHLVATSEGEVWFFTNDGDQVATARPEAVSFTKIATRRARNPELERMMYKMEQNMNRRMAAQQAEIEAMLRAQAEADAEGGYDPETGEVLVDDEFGAGDDTGGAGEAAGGEGSGAEPPAAGQVASVKPAAARIPSGPRSA